MTTAIWRQKQRGLRAPFFHNRKLIFCLALEPAIQSITSARQIGRWPGKGQADILVAPLGIKVDTRGHGDPDFIEHPRTEILAVIGVLLT
jgi:hypothetical protein